MEQTIFPNLTSCYTKEEILLSEGFCLAMAYDELSNELLLCDADSRSISKYTLMPMQLKII